MASYNRVVLMGNLTRDPQLRYLPSQTQVVEFGLAMNRRFKGSSGEDRDETTFVDVSAFGKTAELINQYFTKGKPILVEGRLKYDQWEDKNGGGKRSKLTVVCESFQFVGTRDGGGGGAAGGGGYDPGAQTGGGEHEQQAPAARSAAPARPPAARPPAPRPAPAAQPPAEPPFGDEPQTFQENDIPF
jgi:single-strand DNA-binding protein